MFESARLKLTAWYLALIMGVSLLFSFFIYAGVNAEFQRFEHIDQIIQERKMRGLSVPYSLLHSSVDQELIDQARARLIGILTVLNLGILSLSGIAGYFLAGRTLKPIKQMVDEQNRFVTDASHELRTPLTALRSEIEVNLLNKKLTLAEAKALLTSNLEEVVHLQSLSDNLLELTHYERMTEKKAFGPLDIRDVIQESLKYMHAPAKQKEIILEISLVSATVFGDKVSLRELFTILLDNAIKYSHKGGKIRIAVRTSDASVRVSIADEGIGISAKDLPHIFDRFYRADKSRSKHIEGFGLGLAIAQKIVDHHRGVIRAKSRINKGTLFTVRLPRKK